MKVFDVSTRSWLLVTGFKNFSIQFGSFFDQRSKHFFAAKGSFTRNIRNNI
jgi:hypothetical protein